jgi:hypothetical protein
MINRTLHIVGEVVGKVVTVGASITALTTKYFALSNVPFSNLNSRYLILHNDTVIAFDVYKTQMELHVPLFNFLTTMFNNLVAQAASLVNPFG